MDPNERISAADLSIELQKLPRKASLTTVPQVADAAASTTAGPPSAQTPAADLASAASSELLSGKQSQLANETHASTSAAAATAAQPSHGQQQLTSPSPSIDAVPVDQAQVDRLVALCNQDHLSSSDVDDIRQLLNAGASLVNAKSTCQMK